VHPGLLRWGRATGCHAGCLALIFGTQEARPGWGSGRELSELRELRELREGVEGVEIVLTLVVHLDGFLHVGHL